MTPRKPVEEEAGRGVPEGAVEGSEAVQEAPVDAEAVEVGADGAPVGAELAAAPDPYLAMDRLDAEQALDALQGRPSEVMVFSFKPSGGGAAQSGLSFAGVAEVVRTLNENGHTGIRVSSQPPQFEDVQEEDEKGNKITFVQATVYAEDTVNGGGMWGTAKQAKFQVFRDANRKPKLDSFARAKALSKAQRNAMQALTPVVFRETLIAQMLKDETRVRQIRAGEGASVQVDELPPPLQDEKADKLRAKVRGLYDEIKVVNRLAMLPAVFNQYLTRAEHSHERLEDLIAHLEQVLGAERAKAESDG